MRCLAITDEAGDVRDGYRGLREKLGRRPHATAHEVLAERALAEALVGPLQLPRRARERPCDHRDGEALRVVAIDHEPRLQVEAPLLLQGTRAHDSCSEDAGATGRPGRQPA